MPQMKRVIQSAVVGLVFRWRSKPAAKHGVEAVEKLHAIFILARSLNLIYVVVVRGSPYKRVQLNFSVVLLLFFNEIMRPGFFYGLVMAVPERI